MCGRKRCSGCGDSNGKIRVTTSLSLLSVVIGDLLLGGGAFNVSWPSGRRKNRI